jgi:hypothetical protein
MELVAPYGWAVQAAMSGQFSLLGAAAQEQE